LIQFMLGDLAERLKPVGRLDLLDSTIAEVNKFYSEVAPEKMTPDGERNRAKALQEVANIRYSQGRFDEAYASYSRSIAAYRELTARYPQNLPWQLELAVVLNDLSIAYGQQGDFTKGAAVLEEGLKLFQGLVAKEPRNGNWLMNLAGAAQNLSLGYLHLGNLVRTGELLRIAEEAGRRCVAVEPAKSKPKEVLAIIVGTHGDYLKRVDKIGESMRAYDEKLRILSELVAQEPKNQNYRYDLAMGLDPPAQINIDQGRYSEAREALQRGAGILDQLIAEDPANREWQLIRTNTLTNLGISFRGEDNVGEALATFQRIWDLSHEHPEVLTAYPRWAADCRIAMETPARCSSNTQIRIARLIGLR